MHRDKVSSVLNAGTTDGRTYLLFGCVEALVLLNSNTGPYFL